MGQQSTDELPAIEIRFRDARPPILVYIDGRISGIDGLVINRIPIIVARALEAVAPDWPPAETAVGLADGIRKHGSTGQLFEVRGSRWNRVRGDGS